MIVIVIIHDRGLIFYYEIMLATTVLSGTAGATVAVTTVYFIVVST